MDPRPSDYDAGSEQLNIHLTPNRSAPVSQQAHQSNAPSATAPRRTTPLSSGRGPPSPRRSPRTALAPGSGGEGEAVERLRRGGIPLRAISARSARRRGGLAPPHPPGQSGRPRSRDRGPDPTAGRPGRRGGGGGAGRPDAGRPDRGGAHGA